MAIANITPSDHSITNDATLAEAHVVSAAAADPAMFVWLIPTTATFSDILTHTYNSISLTLIGSVSDIRFSRDLHLYYLVNPATGSNSLSFTFGVAGQAQFHAVSMTGVDQATAYDGLQNPASANDATPSVTVSSAAGNLVIGAVALMNAGITITLGADQTLIADTVVSNNGTDAMASSHEPGAASVTHSYGLSSAVSRGIIAINVRAAAGGGGGGLPIPKAHHHYHRNIRAA